MVVRTLRSATRIAVCVATLAIYMSCADPVPPPVAMDTVRGASSLALETQSAVASVTVTVLPTTISVGQTARTSATVRDAAGVLLPGREVRWRSGSPAVATVDEQTGIVTGAGAGQTELSAWIEGVVGPA